MLQGSPARCVHAGVRTQRQRQSHTTIIHCVITDRVVYYCSDNDQPDSEQACGVLYANALSERIKGLALHNL